MADQIQIENLLFVNDTVSLNDTSVKYRIFKPVFQWNWYDADRNYITSTVKDYSAGTKVLLGATYVKLTVWGKLGGRVRIMITQTRLIEIPKTESE